VIIMDRKVLGYLVAGLLCLSAPATVVAQQGDWLVRAGWSQVDPKDDNLKLGSDTVLQVHQDERFTFNVTYMIRDNLGIELLASDKWNHGFKTYVNNLAPSVLSGEVEHIPPTLSLNYHFNAINRFRPYLGAGLNYTMFSGEKPSGLSLDNSLGIAAQAGVDMDITDKWFLNYAVRWIDIDADAKLNGDKVGTIEIDPWVFGLHVGYRFGNVRPAWAHSCGCKSRRKLTTDERSEAQLHEGDRVWEGSVERKS
jgi:outer membrane protein